MADKLPILVQSATYNPDQQFELISVLVYREGWEEKQKIDFKKLVVDLDIFEDIFSPTLSMTITLADPMNISSTFPLVGGEKVQVSFKCPTYEDIGQVDMVIAKIGPRIKESATSTMTTYVIQLVTEDRYLDTNKQISGAYQGSYSDIVEKVLNELKSSKPLNSDVTIFNQKFIAPYWTPLKICSWIAGRAVGDSYDPFLFYETLDGYNFKSVLSLYRQKPYTKLYLEKAKLAEDTGNGDRNWRKVIKLDILESGDKMRIVNTGAFGGKVYVMDTATKRLETQEYDYDSISTNKDFALIDKFPLFDDIDSREHYSFVLAKSDKSHEGAIYRNMVMNLIDYYRLKVVVAGDIGYKVGQILELNLVGNEISKDDPLLSGRWLIGSLRHKIVGNKYECHMELFKDSYPIDIKPLINMKGREVKNGNTGTGTKTPSTESTATDTA